MGLYHIVPSIDQLLWVLITNFPVVTNCCEFLSQRSHLWSTVVSLYHNVLSSDQLLWVSITTFSVVINCCESLSQCSHSWSTVVSLYHNVLSSRSTVVSLCHNISSSNKLIWVSIRTFQVAINCCKSLSYRSHLWPTDLSLYHNVPSSNQLLLVSITTLPVCDQLFWVSITTSLVAINWCESLTQHSQ